MIQFLSNATVCVLQGVCHFFWQTDSVVTGSAYKPQVEAISPTLPADDAHGNEIRHSIDELVSHIHRVDRDIQHLSNNLEKLKKKQASICHNIGVLFAKATIPFL